MIDKIKKVLSDVNYKRSTFEELKKLLNIKTNDEFVSFTDAMNNLEDSYVIKKNSLEKYDFAIKLGFHRGSIIVKEKGFGFVVLEDEKLQDVFIPKNNVNGAMNKDEVVVKVANSKTKKNSLEGEVVKVLKRGLKHIIGTYFEKEGKGFLKPDDKSISSTTIIIKKDNNLGAMPMHKVKVKVIEYISNNKIEGQVDEILGHKNDPGVDILSVVHKFGIKLEFEDDTLEEAERIPLEVSPSEFKDRRDLRELKVVTIDGADAKDLDDAIHVSKLKNGNHKLGVYIADVSHYIKEGTALDKEAYNRGTSVYLADRVIPMIPHRLSNGICSLNPKVDRLVMACEMEINNEGKVVNYDIFESVINSNERMTYSDVNKILEKDDESLKNKYKDLLIMFNEMNILAKNLGNFRTARGSLNFETNESKIIINNEGKAIDIQLRQRGTSEKIIEEFMLKANETVAEHVHRLKYPFIYRIHENPSSEKLEKLIRIVKTFGYDFKGTIQKMHQKELQSILGQVVGEPEEKAINTLMLRSMMKAKYSEQSVGHYGLASEFYSHFTSPIRRYPDTIVHRLLREYIIFKKTDQSNLTKKAKLMPMISLHTSNKERNAIDCERDVLDMKKAEYMEDHVGEVHKGIVSSVTSFGLFIELPNTVEGLVHILDMDDDYYEFHEDKMSLIGRRKKKIFRIGDGVEIKVKAASKEESQIDFELMGVTNPNKRKELKNFTQKKGYVKGKNNFSKNRPNKNNSNKYNSNKSNANKNSTNNSGKKR